LASTPLLGNVPSELDLADKFPRPGNQGQQSSCVGWAISYLKAYQEGIERRWPLASPHHQFSPAYVYNQIRGVQGCIGGSTYVDAMNLLRRDGIATLAAFPYVESSCDAMPAG
jgi:hypothetical protein